MNSQSGISLCRILISFFVIYSCSYNLGLWKYIFNNWYIQCALVDKFGLENFSREIVSLFKKEPFEEVELVHVVRPRSIYNENKLDKKNMPFQSVYFDIDFVFTKYCYEAFSEEASRRRI